MKIHVVGSGYVGLCTAVGFASLGHDVTCVDVDSEKVKKINSSVAPIYEKDLDKLLRKTVKSGRLSAATGLPSDRADFIFIAVGTPSRKDGSIDLRYVEQAAKDTGKYIASAKNYVIVVIKSTVLPGTTEKIVIPAIEKTSGKKSGKDFGICTNPEFFREGAAMEDFFKPDRIIIGQLDTRSGDALEKLYSGFGAPIKRTNTRTAELIKYASNAFLATKISFINEIGNICKRLDVDVYEVADGMGLDSRISPHFLKAGIGFGGSCFRKDVEALLAHSDELGTDNKMLGATLEVNLRQPGKIIELLKKRAGNIAGKKIAVLGLAFKADTDDIRDAPSIPIISELLRNKCIVQCYDPRAAENTRNVFPGITYAASASDALDGADACIILTEWDDFRKLSDKDFSRMKNKLIIEGRRVLDRRKVENFEGVCW